MKHRNIQTFSSKSPKHSHIFQTSHNSENWKDIIAMNLSSNKNCPIKIKHFHMLWTNNTHVHSRCMLNCGILNYYLVLFSLQAVWTVI
jgi:hypothetical protein